MTTLNSSTVSNYTKEKEECHKSVIQNHILNISYECYVNVVLSCSYKFKRYITNFPQPHAYPIPKREDGTMNVSVTLFRGDF